jgi:hypothetical protein
MRTLAFGFVLFFLATFQSNAQELTVKDFETSVGTFSLAVPSNFEFDKDELRFKGGAEDPDYEIEMIVLEEGNDLRAFSKKASDLLVARAKDKKGQTGTVKSFKNIFEGEKGKETAWIYY